MLKKKTITYILKRGTSWNQLERADVATRCSYQRLAESVTMVFSYMVVISYYHTSDRKF